MADGATRPGRSVLGRGLTVLGSFSEDRPVLTLGAIVRATGLPSATAYRLVAELVRWGALERTGRGRYRIGMRLWQVGSLAPVARGLRDAALPYLQDLSAVTGHPVHLVVLDGPHALFLERLAGSAPLPLRSQVGRRLPLHASGPGKVLLAHAPAELLEEVLAAGLTRIASGTITDPARLTAALADIRRTGYCLSRNEMTEGVSTVAAPVAARSGEVVAGISVVVPSRTANLAPLVPAVRMAAGAITRALRPGSPLSGNPS